MCMCSRPEEGASHLPYFGILLPFQHLTHQQQIRALTSSICMKCAVLSPDNLPPGNHYVICWLDCDLSHIPEALVHSYLLTKSPKTTSPTTNALFGFNASKVKEGGVAIDPENFMSSVAHEEFKVRQLAISILKYTCHESAVEHDAPEIQELITSGPKGGILQKPPTKKQPRNWNMSYLMRLMNQPMPMLDRNGKPVMDKKTNEPMRQKRRRRPTQNDTGCRLNSEGNRINKDEVEQYSDDDSSGCEQFLD